MFFSPKFIDFHLNGRISLDNGKHFGQWKVDIIRLVKTSVRIAQKLTLLFSSLGLRFCCHINNSIYKLPTTQSTIIFQISLQCCTLVKPM